MASSAYRLLSFLNKIPLTFGGKGWPHLYHKISKSATGENTRSYGNKATAYYTVMNLSRSDQIFCPFQFSIQILKRVTKIIFLIGDQSGISEPVHRSIRLRITTSRPSTVRRSPDSIASPSVSKFRSSGMLILAPLASKNLRSR